jgi:hypothetical protein
MKKPVITTSKDNIVFKPFCDECGKEIFGLVQATCLIGAERPTFMHTACYERLKEYEFMYKELCK